MHIVEVNHMLLDGGGREEHVFQISKYLSLKGHRVTIVTSDYTPTGEYIIKKKVDKIPGIKIVTLKGFQTNIPPGRIQIPDLMEFLYDYKADIIHGHGMGEQPPQDALYAAKIKQIPFVFTPHFAPYTIYKTLKADHIWKVIQQYHLYNMLGAADMTVAVSPDEEQDIKYFTGYTGNNFEVIPNGFEQDIEKITNDAIKATYGKYAIPEGRKYIVFIGPITNPRKGAYEAIQAFRAAREVDPDLHLILIGSWDSRLSFSTKNNNATKILQKLAKAHHVTVTGWVSEQDKYALLSGAHVFISPTAYEAFGIALCESLYNRLPVITTDVGGCRYVVRNRIDGILIKDQHDIKAFTKAILTMIRDPQKTKKMGEAGHKRVEQMFSWKKTGDKLEALYKKLIHNKEA